MGIKLPQRLAFSLVELVVVVLILGILSAIAAPRLMDVSATATDNGLMQTLSVVRDAIQRFVADNGGILPGADGNPRTFKSDLDPLINGRFPACPVGPNNSAERKVKMNSGTGPVVADATPARRWKYYYETGVFIVNYDKPTFIEPTVRYDEL